MRMPSPAREQAVGSECTGYSCVAPYRSLIILFKWSRLLLISSVASSTWLVSNRTFGVMKTISSVRPLFDALAPKRPPMRGIRERNGTPSVELPDCSEMKPAMATVSPSWTVSCVEKVRRENDGELIPPADGACGALTSWSMIIVTTPLELTLDRMLSVTRSEERRVGKERR